MPPVITSSCTKPSCADMNNLLLSKSSDNTSAVAFEVEPVIVSPLWNLPNPVSSKSILSPASSDVLSVANFDAFNTKLFLGLFLSLVGYHLLTQYWQE